MVMWPNMAIVTSAVVQARYLARLTHLTELFQDAMNRSQRNMRLLSPHRGINVFRAWVVFRSQEGTDDGEPLRGNGEAPFMAALYERRHSPGRVARMPSWVQQPEFHSRPPTMVDATELSHNQRHREVDASR
jgi:hypothetical protein